ncbi:Pentatricopeptide repeat-containing protein, mitochondrial [Zostera marina]|uniref:Pentatricopeptide repeat-containing protein, mitochondrial n=1 Tax=Zostera marina TaxID=29655 RepID=A0A0K9P2P7_ZOSMR|nr:Pentatricopeptide repeat-containing protein, mitochondrial [Zostera marina]
MALRSKLRFILPIYRHSSISSSSATTQFTDPISPPRPGDFEAKPPQLSSFLKLVARARSADEFPSKADAVGFLKSSSQELAAEPTKDLVLSAIWELRGDPDSGMLAFQWGEEYVLDCPSAWHLMIWSFGNQHRFGEAWGVLRQMQKNRHLPIRRALEIIMEMYVAANESKKAIKTFHAMDKFNLSANQSTFYTLLQALCRSGNTEEAEELLFTDRKLFPLETEGFNIILSGWCDLDLIESKRVWKEMSNYCIYPDATSYNQMIYAFSKYGNLFDALRLFDEMRKRDWVPELKVYNSLIYVLTTSGCLNQAQVMLDRLKNEGLEPDVSTYNSMIIPLCATGKNLDEARGLMAKMIGCGVSPNIETYHAFAMVETQKGSLDLLRRMKNSGLGPNCSTFRMMIGRFLKMELPGFALRLWREIGDTNYNVEPDSALYLELVNGLVSCGWISKGKELYDEMISKGFQQDPKIRSFFEKWAASR